MAALTFETRAVQRQRPGRLRRWEVVAHVAEQVAGHAPDGQVTAAPSSSPGHGKVRALVRWAVDSCPVAARVLLDRAIDAGETRLAVPGAARSAS